MTTIHQQRRRAARVAAEFLVVVAALALLTWVGSSVHAHAVPAAIFFLCLVVLASLRGRLTPALVAAVGGTIAWDLVFTGPQVTPAERASRGALMLAAFGATAVVITRLVTALRTSEHRWRNVFENNPTMYFMVDADGTVLSVNPFGAESLGYTADELIGRSVLDVFPDESKAAAREHVARCLAHLGQSLSWELRKVRRDGSPLWVRETARAVQLASDAPVVLIACEDITAQKETQDKLRASEARLRSQASLLDLTHDAIFVRDASDVIVYWNRGAEEQYGWSREEAVGRVSHELMRTVFPEPLEEIMAALLRAGRWEGELVHTRRDGERIVVASRWSLPRDERGEPAGVLETNNDVTQRKRAEEELRRSEAYLSEAQRLSHTGSFGWNVSDGTIYWSDETSRIFGVDRATPPSIALVLERTHPDDRLEVRRTVENAARDGRDFEHEYRVLRPDGSLRDLHVVSRAVRNESEQLEFVGAVMDVTEQTRAERDLRESARRYQNIFQMAAVSIWEEDFSRVKAAVEELRAGGVRDFRRYFAEHPAFVADAVRLVRIVDVNDTTLTLFGARSKEDLLESLHRIFTPETLHVFAGELLAVAEGRTFFSAEAPLQTLDGERRDVLITIAFPPEPTTLDSVLVTIMDITGRRRAEEALQRAQGDLARASTLTTLGELAGSIAHELRQPLAAISMNGSATLRWLNRETPDLGEARAAASRIVREAQRADEVIRSLRRLLEKSELRREPLDVNDAIEEVLRLVRGELRRNDVSVRTALAADLPPALGDRVQLQQVVLNLLVNAIEAMAGVTGRPRALVVRTERADPWGLAVSVEDTGPGLDAASAERVFEPFFTTKPHGLGLGLSICRSVVEAHGGRLSASPRAPYGTTFRFTVPAAAGAASLPGSDPRARAATT